MNKLYSRKETAQTLGISLATLDTAKRDGAIAFVQFKKNGKVYFTEDAIEKYIERCTHHAIPMPEKRLTFRNPRNHN